MTSIQKQLFKMALFNTAIFVALYIVYLVLGFVLSSNTSKRFGSDAGILFVFIITVHLFINYLLLQKQRLASTRYIFIFSMAIIAGYVLLLII
jgi:hypothetical protein